MSKHQRLKSSSFILFILILSFSLLAGCRSSGEEQASTPAVSRTAVRPERPSAKGKQQLLVMPDDGPGPILELIDGAQESIRFKIYLFTYREARQALIKAANRGVSVQVLIDPDPIGGGESNAETARLLREGGVDVKWAHGAFKHHHEKSMVIDDRLALIATFNFTYGSFTQNREFALLTTQPDVVADVASIFDADWAGEGVHLDGDSPLVLSPDNSRKRITELIRGAKRSLWLEESTLLDADITRELAKAAKRGVDVRFIAPRREHDVAAENYQAIRDAGAQVVFLSEPYVHAKAIVADGRRAFVGSVNLSYTSFELNRELGILTEDVDVINRLQTVMDRDWRAAGGSDDILEPTKMPANGMIPWQDAENYVGQEVTVQGVIVRTYDSDSVTFLNFDEDYRNTLTLVIFPSLYDAFPDAPADYFHGKMVEVQGTIQMYEGTPEIVIEDASQIRILGEEGSRSSEATPSVSQEVTADSPSGVIPWQDAGKYIGHEVVVEGDIVRTYNSGKAAFLNFDEDWQHTLNIVIFASDFDAFPQLPDQLYNGKHIRVHGKIKKYRDAPEIVVESPDQIEVLADNGSQGATQLSSPQTPKPPKGVVPWQEAGRYVGQTITVEGRVVRTKDIGSITFLNFSKKRGDFVVIVRAEDYGNFPSPPAELYKGKKVWVTGEVTMHKGTPQIVVHGPEQIEVFE